MADFRPFRGYRPKPELVEKIASPPYDVLSSEEARTMAHENPYSFLHVVKPEIDLPEDADHYGEPVYLKGKENLQWLINNEYLIRDLDRSYYVYQQRMGDHVQVGVMGAASVDEYISGKIKKHELTRADKEADRTKHIDTIGANTGPVFLTYKADNGIDAVIDNVRKRTPTYDFTASDGVGHTLWAVHDSETVEAIRNGFAGISELYIADGHHRSASAANVGVLRRERKKEYTGQEPFNYFMAVLFPDNQLQILDYNRVVVDLNKHTPDEFLALISTRFNIMPTQEPKPPAPRQFGMYLGGKWFRLTAKEGTFDPNDPVGSLDVAILSGNILANILDIQDLRTDKRIDFVGGIRGTGELERLVDSGKYVVAFAMHPTTVEQLMAIADAGMIMPPKSTWFEPKLRSGVVVRTLDE